MKKFTLLIALLFTMCSEKETVTNTDLPVQTVEKTSNPNVVDVGIAELLLDMPCPCESLIEVRLDPEGWANIPCSVINYQIDNLYNQWLTLFAKESLPKRLDTNKLVWWPDYQRYMRCAEKCGCRDYPDAVYNTLLLYTYGLIDDPIISTDNNRRLR